MTSESRYYRVSVSSRINAPPAMVYGIIADYRDHHPHIVPPDYFTALEVLEGGVGAGTRTRVTMQVLGKERVFEQIVTEPEPGRVIMETNADGSAVTTFTVEPAGERASQLTIATNFPRQRGLRGVVERMAVSLLFPRIYARELARLAEYVEQLRSSADAGHRR